MEVGFFDKVLDIKEKLQASRGWPAAAQTLVHDGDTLADDGGDTERYGIVEGSVVHVVVGKGRASKKPPATPGTVPVKAVSRCGRRSVEVAVDARAAVSELRKELERVHAAAGFPLPSDGAYFFIYRQGVMHEERSFRWHGVGPGDEIVVFDGWLTKGPA